MAGEIGFECPNCKGMLKAPPGTEGQEATCPGCNTIVKVPDASANSAPITPIAHPAPPPIPRMPLGPRPAPVGKTNTSGMAIASMVLGIIAVVLGVSLLGLPLAVAAIVLGHISFADISKKPDVLTGKGFAITGFTTGYVALVLSLIVLLFWGTVLAAFGAFLEGIPH